MAVAEVTYLDPRRDPDSPEAVRDRLLKYLTETRSPWVATLEAYYDGNHPLPSPPQSIMRLQWAKQQWDSLSHLGITNYMPPVADAPADRLKPIGFRVGGEPEADPGAWDIWQRNHLDADAPLAFRDALKTGQSFALVWPVDGRAEITIEHPAQAVVCYVPGSRRKRAAGLKQWCEDDGTRRVVLYLPDEVYKWQGAEGKPLEEWQPVGETWPIANPLGVVPLIEFRANPSTRPAPYGGGRGEFELVLTDQNRINKTAFDRLVTGEFQAFRQRYAIGWEPEDVNQALQASVARMMAFPDGVTVGEFSQADFSGFLNAIDKDVAKIASTTKTPIYKLGNLVNPPSGDALEALDSDFVGKTEQHRDNFGETLEEVMALGLQIEGSAAGAGAEVVWASVAHNTWAEKADAAVKMRSVGVPDEALWEFLEYTPQQIDRFRVQRASQDLFAPAVTTGPVGMPFNAGQ